MGLRLSNIFTLEDYERQPEFAKDPVARQWNLFGYIDARDVAQSCEDALAAELTGAHAVNIVADDIILDLPAAIIHPELAVPEGHGEFETFISNARAKELIGFQPRWSWRDALA